MKIVCVKFGYALVVLFIIVFNSCLKDRPRCRLVPLKPVLPIPGIKLPRVPRTPLPVTRCIYSHQDILDALGTNRVIASSVTLESGTVIQPGNDIAYIAYEAIASTQSNSLFDSKLSVEWRWPGGNWQLSTANVWSLGCVFAQSGQPPYTNIIKGVDTILINTVFYWSTSVHTGERVDYIKVD